MGSKGITALIFVLLGRDMAVHEGELRDVQQLLIGLVLDVIGINLNGHPPFRYHCLDGHFMIPVEVWARRPSGPDTNGT